MARYLNKKGIEEINKLDRLKASERLRIRKEAEKYMQDVETDIQAKMDKIYSDNKYFEKEKNNV